MAEGLRSPHMERKIVDSMGTSSSVSDKSRSKRAKQKAVTSEPQSKLRTVRIKRGLTQIELAEQAGMHRNSILKLENGTTREVTAEHANALAEALKTSVEDLGLRVRAAVEARSIRFRRLSPEQRQIVDEVLSLSPEEYTVIRGAIERLRKKRDEKPRPGRK